MNMAEKMWMVRAGEYGRLIQEFRTKNIVAIGWNLGDLSDIDKSSKIRDQYKIAYKDSSIGTINMNSAQIAKFRFDFKVGDYVITYDPETRNYSVGKIRSDYKYNSNLEYKNVREVSWIKDISRDDLSVATKNSLGAISTIFEVPEEPKRELLDLLEGKKIEKPKEETEKKEEINKIKEDFEIKAREFIKDKLIHLSWEEMQDLVAGLLRSMGYKTIVSPPGRDRGRDIRASPDGLGLQDPTIISQVKHRPGEQMNAQELRGFIGILRGNKRGLYVSTGGFSSEAKLEAERSNGPLTLVDLEELTTLVINNYDNFDSDTRDILPLAKIYWPKST